MKENVLKKIFAIAAITIVMVIFLSMYVAGFIYFRQQSSSDKKSLDAFKQMASSTGTSIFNFYLEQTPFYHASVLLNKTMDKYTGKTAATSVNGTAQSGDIFVELTDGYFTYNVSSTKLEKQLKSAIDFADSLKELGVGLIYLETPHRYFSEDPMYQKVKDFYPDVSEENIAKIHSTFENTNVCTVSLQSSYPLSYFFKTDHHFLPQTGLLLCKALSEELNKNFNFEIDTSLFNLENYEVNTDTLMLGSLGLKVTEIYADLEPIPVLIPKFKTNLSVQIPSLAIDKTGTIDQTLYSWDTLDRDLYDISKYFFYGYGNPSFVSIHNNLKTDGKRILILKDSTANVVYPFLSSACEYIDVIDLRSYRKNLMDYIKNTKPDVVVLVYGLSSFSNPTMFSFGR